MFRLPTTLNINGVEYAIRARGDYRAVLNTMAALTDPDLEGNERFIIGVESFYPEHSSLAAEDYPEAIARMNRFIDCGQESPARGRAERRLYDWEQDEQMICGAITKILRQPVRTLEYLHWWDFMSLFGEIGEGQFSTVLSIRSKLNKGKKLDKWENEFRLKNLSVIKLKTKLSAAEQRMQDAFDADL
jgi:hypothetical protein